MGSVNYEWLSGENHSPLKVVFTLGKINYEQWEKNKNNHFSLPLKVDLSQGKINYEQ